MTTTKNPSDLPFEEIWLWDFEFISNPGEHPDVVCLSAKELRSRQTVSMWFEKGARPPAPFRTDDKVLFVCFAATAELSCHLSLGWPLPAKVLDLSPEFRCIVNGRKPPEGKGLLGALAYYRLDRISEQQKESMRERIMQGRPFTDEERVKIQRYCWSDVDALELLLPRILPEIDLSIALYRGEFITVSAHMERNGVPLDKVTTPRLQDKQTWTAIRDAMVQVIDAKYGVFVRTRDGWAFSRDLFGKYLDKLGILDCWPRLETGQLNLRKKTFENMSRGWPELEELRQLIHVRNKMRRLKLAVGPDGRNRTVLWPFTSKTSRTQPKASQWIFSPAVWLRSLIRPEPGQALAYIDYTAMEFLIAGGMSKDPLMLEFYNSGDPYMAFAVRVGAIPHDATKEQIAVIRDRYKVLLLATQYGMMTETLAMRLGCSTFEAHELLAQHHALFSVYWRWSDNWVAHSFDTGIMSTVFGWTCRTGITEFNTRSIQNWPIQSAGAEILRTACILGHRHGIRLIAPVHDAVMIESPIDRIDADVELMRELMRRASRVVLNAELYGPYELRTKADIIRFPDRFSDKRGEQIWQDVLKLLDGVEEKEGLKYATRRG